MLKLVHPIVYSKTIAYSLDLGPSRLTLGGVPGELQLLNTVWLGLGD